MRDAINASAGEYQRRSSMLRVTSSRPVHSVATGQHNTEQGIRASMVGRSISVYRAVVVKCANMASSDIAVRRAAAHTSANMASRSIHVGSAMAAHSASMVYIELVARPVGLWAT
jgi:hypothetical protein